MNEEQKQYISTLATIAGGLAAGVVGNTGADAVQGAQSAQVAAENNVLNVIAAETAANTAAAMAGAAGNNGKGSTGKGDDEEMGGSCEGTREQCAVRDGTRGPGHTELPIVDKDPTGGKLENPAPTENTATTLTTPDQSDNNGASNTGNTDGAPSTAGNTTTTPIPDGPSQDDLAYLNKITQVEHASIRNKEGRPVGSVINDVQKSRPADILVQDDGRWVILGSNGRVHLVEQNGEVVTSFENPNKNTAQRINSGRWHRATNDELSNFKDKFSDYVRW
ncbi:VENN motif pre-toxin domain-containing protein [Dickeya zeae]|uniref:VENN motif-containing domain-containing protein n=1 Tax=Dickeya zeae TaxID=204042 RepID=A0ABX8VYF9_9GAMM|nr:VENN motif pre-toxin domain-containing protein [Dickeya zeae]QYM92797.1 hypothetical protein FGI21_13475 [Dickeya zeae]